MELLKSFSKFVEEINSNNSRNYKLEVLTKYKDDPDIRYCLAYIFDPYIVTGISDKKLSKEVTPDDKEFKSSRELLQYLKEHNTGRDEDLKKIKHFKESLNSVVTFEEADKLSKLLDAIITKNLPIGVSVLSINKIMPGCCREFNVQLANKYFDDPSVVEGKEFSLTTKIDGSRIIAIKDHGEVFFYTRAGQRYDGLVDLEQELKEKFPDDIALDGEITLLNSEGLDNKAQYKQTMKITRKLGVKHGVKMKVFDIMSANDFKHQSPSMVYKTRREWLNRLFEGVSLTYFELLPILYCGSDTSMIRTILDQQVQKGEEGVMININNALYSFKRTNGLLKCKLFHDVDLIVKDLEEGTNQNTGKLGAFVCEYKGCVVKVGSGISKELREQVWFHKDEWIGRTIVVKYFEETTNADGGVSLRFPTYEDYRTDKVGE